MIKFSKDFDLLENFLHIVLIFCSRYDGFARNLAMNFVVDGEMNRSKATAMKAVMSDFADSIRHSKE